MTEGEVVLKIGEGRARLDRGPRSLILRQDLRRMWMVDHRRKTYETLVLPVHLDDLLTAAQRESLAPVVHHLFAPDVQFETADEPQRLGAWSARKATGHISFGEMRMEMEVEIWLTDQLAVDWAPYQDLIRSEHELNLLTRSWTEEVLDLGGFPVLHTTRVTTPKYQTVETRRLESIERRELSETDYLPPSDYKEVPLDLNARFQVVGSEPDP